MAAAYHAHVPQACLPPSMCRAANASTRRARGAPNRWCLLLSSPLQIRTAQAARALFDRARGAISLDTVFDGATALLSSRGNGSAQVPPVAKSPMARPRRQQTLRGNASTCAPPTGAHTSNSLLPGTAKPLSRWLHPRARPTCAPTMLRMGNVERGVHNSAMAAGLSQFARTLTSRRWRRSRCACGTTPFAQRGGEERAMVADWAYGTRKHRLERSCRELAPTKDVGTPGTKP